VRVDPDVLQDGGAFWEEVAAESVVSIQRVWEVDRGDRTPSEDLVTLVVVCGRVQMAHFEETGF
jgi:hypothetical protein